MGPEVVKAAKEALARMPTVDVKLMQKRREERSGKMTRISSEAEGDGEDDIFGVSSEPAAAAPSSGGGEASLLDDIFSAPPAAVQNGGGPTAKPVAPAAAASQPSDVDLLSDIFSAPPVAPQPAAPIGGGLGVAANPLDIFAPQPASTPAPAPAAASSLDPFGAAPSMASPAPAPVPASPQPTPAAPMAAPAAAPAPAAEVIVHGLSHGGLTIDFQCAKPDAWNKQDSELTARFTNNTAQPIHGLHLQVAVPKHATMEMRPPTSTTVPPSAMASGREVTQTIKVTNTLVGTKRLQLRLKVGFTSMGSKVEHMATCSGFPEGY